MFYFVIHSVNKLVCFRLLLTC